MRDVMNINEKESARIQVLETEVLVLVLVCVVGVEHSCRYIIQLRRAHTAVKVSDDKASDLSRLLVQLRSQGKLI